MKVLKSNKFRLKPTEDQVAMLKQHGGNSRFVWNKLLEYSNQIKEKTGKYPTWCELAKQIIQLKLDNKFIKISYSQPIQVNALKLSRTFLNAFKPEIITERNKKIAIANKIQDEEKKTKAIAKAMNFGFPKFKSKAKSNDSIFYPQNFIIKRSRINFPKLGWINYIRHREIEGKPKFVTITQDGNQYYVSITSEVEIKEKPKPDLNKSNIVGIDVGLINFAVLSDKTVIENPRTLEKNLKKIKRESRWLSRKEFKETDEKTFYGKPIKKSSKNRDKQIVKVQKLHRKIRNIRKDFLHKTTHHIIAKYDGVVLENLDIKGMLKKNCKATNLSTSDVSWYEFGRQLEYKSAWNFKHFCRVDQYFASTQLCSNCGSKAHLSSKDRAYLCPNCKTILDRDYNASINLQNEGMRILKISCEQEKENKSNTVATTGINACGLDALASRWKQEKRKFQQPVMAVA